MGITFRNTKRIISADEELFFVRRPLLAQLVHARGDETLLDYVTRNVRECIVSEGNAELQKRRKEFANTCGAIAEERLGISKEEIATHIERYYFASTADHHAPLNSGLALGANMLFAGAFASQPTPVKYIPVFSCASISQNHEDFPRGLTLHHDAGKKWEQRTIPFLPSKNRNSVVYGFRAMTGEEIQQGMKKLDAMQRADELTNKEAEAAHRMIADVLCTDTVQTAKDLCTQFTQIAQRSWRVLFPEAIIPQELLYLDFESVTARLLIDHHCDEKTVLHQILFDPKTHDNVIPKLVTAMQRYVRQGSLQTYLFWGLTDKGYRVSLTRDGEFLKSKDDTMRIPLRAEAIAQALREQKIMPDLFTVFCTLFLYYRLSCFGGFNQMHYLAAMEKAYQACGIDIPGTCTPQSYFHYGLETLFLQGEGGTSVSPSGIDLFAHQEHETLWKNYTVFMQEYSVREAVSQSLPLLSGVLSENTT